MQDFCPEDNVTGELQMIVHPEERVADFAKAGSDIISVHAEPAATVHLDRTINQVWLILSTQCAVDVFRLCTLTCHKLVQYARSACCIHQLIRGSH